MCFMCNNTRQAALNLVTGRDHKKARNNSRWVKAYAEALRDGRKVTLFRERNLP